MSASSTHGPTAVAAAGEPTGRDRQCDHHRGHDTRSSPAVEDGHRPTVPSRHRAPTVDLHVCEQPTRIVEHSLRPSTEEAAWSGHTSTRRRGTRRRRRHRYGAGGTGPAAGSDARRPRRGRRPVAAACAPAPGQARAAERRRRRPRQRSDHDLRGIRPDLALRRCLALDGCGRRHVDERERLPVRPRPRRGRRPRHTELGRVPGPRPRAAER